MAKLMFENILNDQFSRRLTFKNRIDTNSEDAYEFGAFRAFQKLFWAILLPNVAIAAPKRKWTSPIESFHKNFISTLQWLN